MVARASPTSRGKSSRSRSDSASQREQRERGRVAADRRGCGRRAELERPPRELLDRGLVAREERRLERADRAPPGLAAPPALAPRRGRTPEPLRGLVSLARHQPREGGGVRDVPLPDERPLVGLAVLARVTGFAVSCEGGPVHPVTRRGAGPAAPTPSRARAPRPRRTARAPAARARPAGRRGAARRTSSRRGRSRSE